ncbi:MAG: vitamin K epoxide reductase family protein, partial [Dysgonamonadaceae bacterium]|nr:vitamin K epoxide reductase family protein [Dysgonamonadaceae bacterium]
MPSLIFYLALINILALPYSFWSVWYQKFKAKQWCVLCLIVQVLLWLIFAVNLGFGWIQLPDFNTTSLINWLIIACIFGTIILSINILIPSLSKGRFVSYLKQEINSIKADEAVFR